MLSVVEVKTKKQQKEFLDFPLRLYKGCPYFVPPLYGDEKKMFRPDYVYYDTCETVFFNAYRNGEMVGRIQGILQKASNEKTGEKRVRFTRFDALDDQEIASALFAAVENWAVQKGMNVVCGPLGFSDLEREGLLIEGFDELATFEEQYNYEYYGKLIEACGYGKEVDWEERKIYAPDQDDGSLDKMADFVMKRYNLHIGQARNKKDFIRRYGTEFFELLDKGYKDIYGTVPFTEGMRKMLIDNFMLIIELKYVGVVLDENDRLIMLGILFPSLSKAVQPSGGKLTPAAIARMLYAARHPKLLDFGLIAVDPEWANRGVATIASAHILHLLREPGIEYAETNLNLEDNHAIINMWKRFKAVQHKRRRAYIKHLGD